MAKPTIDVNKTEWASDDIIDPGSGTANKIEQSSTKKSDGWSFLEKPPFNWFNYWMNIVYLYLKWIVEEVIEGNFTFTGNKTFDGSTNMNGDILTNGNIITTIRQTDTTDSTSKDTGAFVTDGGIGVEKSIIAGLIIRAISGIYSLFRNSAGSESSTSLHTKVIEIGDWDMDTSSGEGVTHNLGANYKKIRSINVIIRHDDDTIYRQLSVFQNGADPALLGGGVVLIDSTIISLNRRTGGIFDSTDYDSTSYNRGWIYIVYEN